MSKARAKGTDACLGGAPAAGWCDAAQVSSESKRPLFRVLRRLDDRLALILGSCLSNTAFAFGVDEQLDAAAGVGKHDAQRLLDQHDTTVRTAELDNALVLREMRTVFAVRSASGSGQLSASRRRGAGCTSCRLAAPESQPLHRRREDVAPGDLRVLAL